MLVQQTRYLISSTLRLLQTENSGCRLRYSSKAERKWRIFVQWLCMRPALFISTMNFQCSWKWTLSPSPRLSSHCRPNKLINALNAGAAEINASLSAARFNLLSAVQSWWQLENANSISSERSNPTHLTLSTRRGMENTQGGE